MINDIRENRQTFKELFDGVITTNAEGITFALDEALREAIKVIVEQAKAGRKLLFIGNGGSASITSHMAVDFWKNAGIQAIAFNDSSMLTCISNDYGYEHVFEKPIEMFAEPQDILIAISSSGQSENILRAAAAAKKKGIKVIALSGFNKDNPLRVPGKITEICFVSSSKIEALDLSGIDDPVIALSVEAGTQENAFVFPREQARQPIYLPKIKVPDDFMCVETVQGRLDVVLINKGRYVWIEEYVEPEP